METECPMFAYPLLPGQHETFRILLFILNIKLTPGKIATKVLMIKDLINDTQFKPVFSQGILTEWITKLCGFKHKGILIFAIKR